MMFASSRGFLFLLHPEVARSFFWRAGPSLLQVFAENGLPVAVPLPEGETVMLVTKGMDCRASQFNSS